VNEIVVTVIGRDRTGTVADVSAPLAGLGLNLTDSVMTLLRGHFTMTLVCTGDATAIDVETALAPLCADGRLVAAVRQVSPDESDAAPGRAYTVMVHGADRLGIVAAVTTAIAHAGGNIVNLGTRLAGGLYVLSAEVDLPPDVDGSTLEEGLATVAGQMAVKISVRPSDADVM
jgi:glycine cleavage system transcriptional repressor